MPRGFRSFPPRHFPLARNTFQKVVGHEDAVKILLALYPLFATGRFHSFKHLLLECKLSRDQALRYLSKLERNGLIVKCRFHITSAYSKYKLSVAGFQLLALTFANLRVQRGLECQSILARCRLHINLNNRPKARRGLLASA